MMNRLKDALGVLSRFTQKHRLLLSAVLAVLLSGLLALYNVSSGPLRNLNDIGGWDNRALFIAMSAAVHLSMLLLCAWLSHVSLARTALRQIIVTAGMVILLLAINQKTYAYVNVMQPVIRAMDEGGLAAGVAAASGMSAPMLLLMYAITRGPVYDMYLLKLFAIGCDLLLGLLAMRAADRNRLGLRAEVLLALCMILPQGFMNAACSALPEIAAVTLLAVSLTLALGCDRPKTLASGLCYGAACALSGAALYALPVYLWLVRRGGMKRRELLFGACAALLLCVPAMACGMPALRALGSLFAANLGLSAYAAGTPGMVSLIPRAAVEEMPQYAPLLRHLTALDMETHAQQFYTQAHFEIIMRGVALAGLALYLSVCALAWRAKDKTPLHRAMLLVLGALIVCPNVTSAAWLLLDVLCLYAILAEPGLRLPACLVLFATMTSSSYPMTEEVMLPMVYAFILCLAALCMLLGVIPTGKEETHE
ncbi:MAG: hypothetical protein SO031_03300 [Candidatus Ventricola sp.]|nr:hypothetical protein [Candidatus Ventricola sp.]